LIQWSVMFCPPCFNRFWGLKYIPRLFSEYMLTFRVEEPMTIRNIVLLFWYLYYILSQHHFKYRNKHYITLRFGTLVVHTLMFIRPSKSPDLNPIEHLWDVWIGACAVVNQRRKLCRTTAGSWARMGSIPQERICQDGSVLYYRLTYIDFEVTSFKHYGL
jgi:hypothetical protein